MRTKPGDLQPKIPFGMLGNTGWKRTFYINIGLQTDPLRENGII
jgi:hypothetical protein